MAVVVAIKNAAHVDIEGCDELITFDSNEVQAHYLNIELTKTQSCIWAIHGKNLTYCVTIKNKSTDRVTDLKFYDTLDLGVEYVPGSFRVNGEEVTPDINGRTISYIIPELALNQTITICFQVKVL